jgi:hypothetical protein
MIGAGASLPVQLELLSLKACSWCVFVMPLAASRKDASRYREGLDLFSFTRTILTSICFSQLRSLSIGTKSYPISSHVLGSSLSAKASHSSARNSYIGDRYIYHILISKLNECS